MRAALCRTADSLEAKFQVKEGVAKELPGMNGGEELWLLGGHASDRKTWCWVGSYA